MKKLILVNRTLLALLLTFVSFSLLVQGQTRNNGYVPQVGQEGKDVVWVPTPLELVSTMLRIAEVTSKDFVIDLGSGDGRTVIEAAKLGARSVGIEYNPDMVKLSEKNALDAGVGGKVKFLNSDLFEYDLSEATVITMFLLPDINIKLRPKLLDLKPGTRIVSNTFTMGEWEPDIEVTSDENCNSWCTALMWIVPAKVEGRWKLPPGEITLHQNFQMLTGTLTTKNKTSPITEGKLNGNNITFKVDGATYTGLVTTNRNMLGTVTTKVNKSDWMATRAE